MIPMVEPDATEAASPNHGPRLGDGRVRFVVLHYTGMPSLEAALARLRDPAAQVSAHYVIAPEGRLFALVAEGRRAWHAGVASWAGEADVNSASIGVELAHPGHDPRGGCAPFPEPQMRALARLLGRLAARHGLGPAATLAHSDVAPGRKIDPGEAFDWRGLARLGLALGPPPEPVAPGADDPPLGASLARIGYGDWPEAALLDAFRRRFRPEAVGAGPADAHDAVRAARVAATVARGVSGRDL